MRLRGTIHRSITVRGRAMPLTVERRAIEGRAVKCPPAPQASHRPALRACHGPLASEVAAVLRQRPMRFPGEWYRVGEG